MYIPKNILRHIMLWKLDKGENAASTYRKLAGTYREREVQMWFELIIKWQEHESESIK